MDLSHRTATRPSTDWSPGVLEQIAAEEGGHQRPRLFTGATVRTPDAVRGDVLQHASDASRGRATGMSSEGRS